MQKSKSNAFEDNFRELLNFVSDSIVVINQEGVVLASNKTASALLGLSSEELIGNHIQDLRIIDEKTKAIFKNQLQKRIKGEKIENYEIPVLVNGETKYFEPKGNKIDYFGEPADLIVLRDVTEKRQIQGQLSVKIAQADEQRQESEGRYRKLFQESTDALFVADAKTGTIIDCNNAAALLVEKDKTDLIGQNYSTLRSQMLVKEDSSKELKEQTKGSSITPIEAQILTKDGEKKCVSIKVSFFQFQGKKLIQGTFRDITERKLMQQALIENEEKFHGIANSVKDAVILIDEKGKVTYWNPAAEKTFGYTNEETIGKDIHKLVVPKTICKEGKERINSSLKIFTETGVGYFTVGNVELIGRHKDNSEFPAELSISPIKLHGKWNALGVVKDITDRKKGEQKLRDAEQRYHAIFNEAPLGVLVVDPETAGFVEFNDNAHFQLGYSREEFRGLTVHDIEAKESADEIRLHIAEMLKESKGEFETLHRTKNGDIKNILVTSRTIELAGKKLLHCVYHDTTETKKVQNALVESEARYRQLVELAHEGIWAFNNDFTTVFVNPRMAKMLGYAESEMLGKSLFDFVDDSVKEEAKYYLMKSNKAIKGQFEYAFPLKDGTHINTSITASNLTDDQGQVIGTLALVTDITERKQLEDLVKQRTEQLKQTQAKLVKSERLAAIGELAGMIGHDLRNPLTGIKNSAYFLKKKGKEIPEAQSREMLDIIDKCVDYSNKIVNDLLDYSREIHLELQECSPRNLIIESLAMMNVPEKVEILNHVTDQTSIRVDTDKTKRVFINLIKNGIEAMSNVGKLTIDSTEVNGSLQISFSDTGVGIPDEILPKLFAPLFTTKAQGMGFGLAICKRIIEAHRGTITVKTENGVGSTFTITLPINPKIEIGGEKVWIEMPKSSLSTMTRT